MSKLYSELENLYDQDVLINQEQVSILEWLIKHREDINNIEIDYINYFQDAQEKIADLELKLVECEQEKLLNSYGMDRNADIAEDYKQQIADLEAKLAESEVIIKGGKEEIKDLHRKINEIVERDMNCIQQLKQQLSETDKLMQEYLSKCLSLEQQLAEKDQAIDGLQEINQSLGQTCNNDEKEIERLREQIAEKDELLKQKICDMKSTDFIRMCVDCGFIVQAKEIDNQTAITELEKVKEWLNIPFDENGCLKNGEDLENYIDQQIKSLKGEK